jgi:hypothetical protein
MRAYIAQQINASPETREGASIAVLNGSGVPGAATTEAEELTDKGLDVSQVDNAPAGAYAAVEIYQRTEGMPATKARLESIYKTKVKSESPVPVNGNIDFVIIIGKVESSE